MMRRMLGPVLLMSFLLLPFAARGEEAGAVQSPGATTVIVVRHAEKANAEERDPLLSPAGQARAEALASALESAGVSAIYVTQFKRNHATAEPLAKRLGVPVTERPIAGDVPAYARDLAREVLAQQAGKTVLIVGHSNTVPDLVQAFSGTKVAPLTEADFDNLFVVVVPASGPARLVKARYGQPSAH